MIKFVLDFEEEVEHTEMHKICEAMQKMGYKVTHPFSGGPVCTKEEQEKKPKKPTKQKQQGWTSERRKEQSERIKKRNARAKEIQVEQNCTRHAALIRATKEQKEGKLYTPIQKHKKNFEPIPKPAQKNPCMGCGQEHDNEGDFCADCEEQAREA